EAMRQHVDNLRERWYRRCAGILKGVPPELPPMRDINHHIPLGEENKVADALSRYFEYDTLEDIRTLADYVTADWKLDPEGEDLPLNLEVEIRAIREGEGRGMRIKRPTRRPDDVRRFADALIKEPVEPRRVEAAVLEQHAPKAPETPPVIQEDDPRVLDA
ncbi:hypothetical protein BV25DRAFT_1768641, partial [Artomyces pyxidatus]